MMKSGIMPNKQHQVETGTTRTHLGGTETSFKKVSLQGNNVQGFLV